MQVYSTTANLLFTFIHVLQGLEGLQLSRVIVHNVKITFLLFKMAKHICNLQGRTQNFEKGVRRPKKNFALPLYSGPSLTLHILPGAEQEKLGQADIPLYRARLITIFCTF